MPESETGAVVADGAKKPRSRLSQEDVPGYSLEQALRVPRAIAENYAFKPTRPMHVAGAMGMTPTSGGFRGLTGAAVAYGLTTGAAQAPEIGITPLGLRIVRPTVEGDDIAAKREALLRPKTVGDFLRQYDGAAVPSGAIAKNVLQDKGVPSERVKGVLDLIIEGATAVGFIQELSGKRYVDLTGPTVTAGHAAASDDQSDEPADTAPVSVGSGRTAANGTPVGVTVGAGVHVNIEIHIAADAPSETIEDIFRNMRRYVLNADPQANGDGTPEN
jgi:hypothetical protein